MSDRQKSDPIRSDVMTSVEERQGTKRKLLRFERSQTMPRADAL